MTSDQLNSIVTALMTTSPVMFTLFAVIIIGYFFRAIPKFNNEWLWIVCGAAGAVVFPLLAHKHTDDTTAGFWVRSVFVGLALGMGAWGFHDKLLKQFEDKIPILSAFVAFVDKTGGKSDSPAAPPAPPKTGG
jgi:hypothetical protein